MTASTPYVASLLAVAGVASLVAAIAWHRQARLRVPFAGVCLAIAVWTAAHAVQYTVSTPAAFWFWKRVEWLGAFALPPLWLVFTMLYTGRDRHLTRLTVPLLFVLPVVNLALLFPNPTANPLLTIASTDVTGAVPVVEGSYDPFWWVHIVYAYGLTMVGSGLVFALLASSPQLYRGRALALATAGLAPIAGSVATILGLRPVEGLVLTPFAFGVTVVALAYVLLDRELLETLPVSNAVTNEAYVGEMSEGLIVVDESGAVVDHNDAAAPVFDVGDPSGRQLSAACPALAAVVEAPGGEDRAAGPEEESVTTLQADGHQRYYSVSAAPVERGTGVVATVLSLHDVTDRVVREQRLNVLNRVLRHNLRQELTILLGWVGTARDEASEPAVRTALDRADDAAADLLELSDRARQAEQLLDGDVSVEPVDLAAVVDAAVRGSDGVVAAEDLPASARVLAHDSVAAAVEELLEIAVDRHDESVSVSLRCGDEVATLAVVDDGDTLPAAERRALERGTETDLEHASGVGLWLVTWLVRISGGSVRFDDRGGDGNLVEVSLPLAD
jgi:signal transduction histidine kinase